MHQKLIANPSTGIPGSVDCVVTLCPLSSTSVVLVICLVYQSIPGAARMLLAMPKLLKTPRKTLLKLRPRELIFAM